MLQSTFVIGSIPLTFIKGLLAIFVRIWSINAQTKFENSVKRAMFSNGVLQIRHKLNSYIFFSVYSS